MDPKNDNGAGQDGRGPPADGDAALLLVESLIHGLIERGVLTVADAIEIVDIATEVKAELVSNAARPSAAGFASISRLQSISASLRHDLPRD